MILNELLSMLYKGTSIRIVHRGSDDLECYDEFMYSSPILQKSLADKVVRNFYAVCDDTILVELDWSTGNVNL